MDLTQLAHLYSPNCESTTGAYLFYFLMLSRRLISPPRGDVLNILRKTVGAEVIVTSVPGTGSIRSRAERMHAFLKDRVDASASGSGGTATQVTVPPQFNFLAHSMGGLDCRHLITHVQPKEYVPMSLTTISTPHRGSAFMDWCKV